jgi:hypothetical protein
MKGTTVEARPLGGVATPLPQPGDSATILTNFTVDADTQGWSTRIGYERYRPNVTFGFAPFSTASIGRVDSLHAYQGGGQGSRQIILFESSGTLYLVHEPVTPNFQLLPIRTGRSVPTPSQPASTYCEVAGGVVVTNGDDAPLYIRPWPIGLVADSAATASSQIARNLGFSAAPRAPQALQVLTMSSTVASIINQTGDAVCLWWPTRPEAIGQYGNWGLGYARNNASSPDKTATYDYAVSFISDTGSESALSAPGSVSWELQANVSGFHYCVSLRIPTGPPGTIGRRIYRSQNYSDDSATPGDTTLYYVDDLRNNIEELFFDVYPTIALGAQAPAPSVAAVFPCPRARFSAVYEDCLFLDGGIVDQNTIYFSNPRAIDQFGAADFIRLPGDAGGVTGLFGHYTALVVLRESGVSVIQGNFTDGFRATTVTTQVACRAPSAIDSVPGVGIVFLAQDGVYALSGGLVGGSELTVTRLSDPIDGIMRRMTPDCAARSVARYSPTDRAWHCYIPADGNDRPNLGVIYHVEKQAWSIREGFPVGAIDRLFGGELVFGHHTGMEAATQSNPNPETGLFVISARRALGGSIAQDAFKYGAPPASEFKSAWIDMGDPQALKQVHYVTLWIATSGSFGIEVEAYKDFLFEPVGPSQKYKLQPPDQALKPVYGPSTYPVTRETAVWDTSLWQGLNIVPIRVGVAVQSCAQFAFGFKTSDDVVLVGWEVEFNARGTRTIAGHKV